MNTENTFEVLSKKRIERDIESWIPEILNPSEDGDLNRLHQISKIENLIVTDDILIQLEELVKCLYPRKRLSGKTLKDAALDHMEGVNPDYYGLWVFYPWSNRLVHILPEDEFIKVRSNRNHYKISPEEQEVLACKKVGLIGLSVGQSVAVTMAMERGFGELRLADFDTLELTNLNRIRTGIKNLGVSKVISVAREIMEIDPFLKLKCFTDGITDENMDSFFTEGGDLDLLIDECDGLEIKILAREKAKSMGIPVVMEASDRGMVDVERFDLEPERPLLHGLVGDLNTELLKTLETNEDKIPYMLDIVGLETISTRAKASMLEIGETITTWPQLASAVTLGGGITADVVRRIFLNQFHDSGRYYMDVEEIIGNKKGDEVKINNGFQEPRLADISVALPELPSSLPKQDADLIVQAACHAPSGGNLQPWQWVYHHGALQLRHDKSLTSSFLDFNDIASMIALGASLENAVLKASALGYKTNVVFCQQDNDECIADLSFQEATELSGTDIELGRAVFDRHTNRNIEFGEAIDREHLEYLESIATSNGSSLVILEGNEKDELAKLIAFAERFRIMHPMGHQNFTEEMRWNQEDVEVSKDGIDIETCDLTEGELAGFKLATNKEVIDKLKEWGGGTAFEKLSKKSTESAYCLGVITRPTKSKEDFIMAGRDLERVWIGANRNGIGFQPQSPLSLILERLETAADLNDEQANELRLASEKLSEIFTPKNLGTPIFIFRLFKAVKPVKKSLRRNIDQHYQALA